MVFMVLRRLWNSARRATLCSAMGLTSQKLLVKENRRARRKAAVNFLIDSGAVYSLVPAPTLRRIGVHPYRKVDFALADGRTITCHVGDAYFEFRGEGGAAPVHTISAALQDAVFSSGVIIDDSHNNASSLYRALAQKEISQAAKLVKVEKGA